MPPPFHPSETSCLYGIAGGTRFLLPQWRISASQTSHLSSLTHGHLSCKPQAFEELRCEVWEAEMCHWGRKSGFHPLPRINRRVRKGGRGTGVNWNPRIFPVLMYIIIRFDVYQNELWCTSKYVCEVVKFHWESLRTDMIHLGTEWLLVEYLWPVDKKVWVMC